MSVIRQFSGHGITITVHDVCDSLVKAMADEIRSCLTRRSPDERDYALMLAGGSTPLSAYANVERNPVIAAPSAHCFLSDDRHVPPDSPDSNFGNVRPMIAACGLGNDRILRIPTELKIEESLSFFEAELQAFIERGGSIPLGFLGLGSDGHTASLFSESDLERSRGRLAISVRRRDGLDGISVTPAVLARVQRIVFVVSGSAKAGIVGRFIEDPSATIAGRAVAGSSAVELWCDDASCPDL
ncbi:MAG: 6-phosphogluconolactonase [Verrucomicrobia bacterium]|nr:6-phosphogluconolactonase [Verrucomicrobiota bacterium]